jgi:hypothetical protein
MLGGTGNLVGWQGRGPFHIQTSPSPVIGEFIISHDQSDGSASREELKQTHNFLHTQISTFYSPLGREKGALPQDSQSVRYVAGICVI